MSRRKANESRDCRIFEDFAYRMIDEARRKRCTDIFKLEGNVYAFDSTTIDLCLSVFEWARFRTTNGGVKVHTMYDVETRVPAFVHITPAAVHDMRLARSTYEGLQIQSISLTDMTPLRDLFDKTDYHDVKEQIDNSELLLF